MSESIVIHANPPARPARRRLPPLLLGGFLGMVIGALGLAIVVSTVDVVRAALAGPAVAAVSPLEEAASHELPREWREWKIGVDVDHMYRQKDSPRLDWIRESGRR